MKENPYYHRNRLPHDSPMFFGRFMELDQLRRADHHPEAAERLHHRRAAHRQVFLGVARLS